MRLYLSEDLREDPENCIFAIPHDVGLSYKPVSRIKRDGYVGPRPPKANQIEAKVYRLS